MSKMIQLRGVPDALHRQLKARAAMEGISLSELLLREAQKLADRPTAADLRARLERLSPLRSGLSPTALLREERSKR